MAYKANRGFFKKWSIGMAWTLGVIYADGCIRRGKNNRGRLTIGMQDKDVLEKIKKAMESEHPIKKIDFSKYDTGTWYWLIDIGSKEIYRDLKKIGLTENKSKTMKFPPVPVKYLSHFIRGYFDGDGSALKNRSGKKRIASFVSGSKYFINSLSTILNTLDFRHFVYDDNNKKNLRTSYTNNSFWGWLYKGNRGYYMTRKFNLIFN